MSGSGVLPLMGSTLLLSALHAPPAAAAPPAADDGSDVRSLVERALQAWTDEFQLFVQTHVGAISSVQQAPPAHLPLQSPLASPPVIQPSATLLVRLPALLAKLRNQPVVSRANYLSRVVWAAGRLRAVQQDAAAKLCYENYMSAAAAAHAKSSTGAAVLRGQELSAHVQALYGAQECEFRLLIAGDPLLSNPGSADAAVGILTAMQSAMSLLLDAPPEESHSHTWLLFNGCLVLWQMLEPLSSFGSSPGRALPFLGWVVLVLESRAALCGAEFLPLRVRVYLTVARHAEWEGDVARARAAASRALDKVREVASWEAVQQPVPARTAFVLRQCAQLASAAVFKYAYLSGSVSDAEVEERLVSDFGNDLQGITLLLEMLTDPQARVMDSFVAAQAALVDFLANRERAAAERTRREEEAALAVATEASASAMALASGGGGASGGKPGTAALAKRRKSGSGLLLSSEAILAEAARAAAAAAAPLPAASAASGDKTDRSARKVGSSQKKKGGDSDADEAAAAAAAAAAASAPRDMRDPRAVFLVSLALRKLRELLASPTPLSVLEALSLGLGLGPDDTIPAGEEAAPAPGSKPATVSALVQHDLPGDWVPLSVIFQTARAAFAAGCWAEFTAAADEFDARAALAATPTPARQAELLLNRTAPSGTGMEVQLQLMRRLILLGQSQRRGALGGRGVDSAAVTQFARWILDIAGQGQGPPTGAKSPLSPTASSSTSPSASTTSSASSTGAAARLAWSKAPDLFTDACVFLWKWLLQPMLRLERSPAEDLPRQLHPPALVAAEVAERELDRSVGVAAACTAEHTEALRAGLEALVAMQRLLRVSDATWVAQTALQLVAVLTSSFPSPSSAAGAPAAHEGPDLPTLAQVISVLDHTIPAVEAHLSTVVLQAGRDYLGGVLHSILARWDARVEGVLHHHHQGGAGVVPADGAALPSPSSTQVQQPLAGALSRSESALFCAYSDMLLRHYDAQLRAGMLRAQSAARRDHAKAAAELAAKYALTATYRKAPPPLLLPSYSAAAEKSLERGAGANPYRRAILLLAMLPYRQGLGAQQDFLASRVLPALSALHAQEQALLRDAQLSQRDEAGNVGGGVFELDDEFGTRGSNASRRGDGTEDATAAAAAGVGVANRASKSSRRLPPPRLVARSSTCIILRAVVPPALQRAHRIRGVVLFGKASETGIEVSTACTEHYPCGLEVALPPLDQDATEGVSRSRPIPHVEVRDLLPNTSYVFACAMVNQSGEFVGGIGSTSMRIVTCLPTPLALAQSYLAVTLRTLGDRERLHALAAMHQDAGKKEANTVSAEEEKTAAPGSSSNSSSSDAPQFAFTRAIKTAAWSMLAPFVRIRAQLSHHGRPKRGGGAGAGGAARALGDGDRLNLARIGSTSDEEDSDGAEQKEQGLVVSAASKPSRGAQAGAQRVSAAGGASSTASQITPYANRSLTNGVRDSYVLGPAAPECAGRIDVWQLALPLVQAAPRPLLYALAGAAHMHADCLALAPLVSPATPGSLQTKPLALLQRRTLEVVRSLLLGLQLALVLEDWRAAGATLTKCFDALAPLLDSHTAGVGATLGTGSGLVLGPLATLFEASMAIRARLPYELVSPSLQRTCTRLVYALVRSLQCRNEPALLVHVLGQYAAMQSATHAAASAAYAAAHASHRARAAQIELAKLRAAQLREALAAEAAAEEARREKEAAKETAKRTKRERSATAGSNKKKHFSTATAAEGGDDSAPSVQQTSRDESKEDGSAAEPSAVAAGTSTADPSMSALALQTAQNPAVQSILTSPLLTATAGHLPHPRDYFRPSAEDAALVSYLLGSPVAAVAHFGRQMAAATLGRGVAAPGASLEEEAAVAGATGSASGSAAASAAGAQPSVAAAGTAATGASGGAPVEEPKKRSGKSGISGEDDAPAPSRVDIELTLADALLRCSAPYSTSMALSAAMTDAFAALQADWKAHPRFLETGARFAARALEQGALDAARTVLAALDDVADFAAEPRLRSEEEERQIERARMESAPPPLPQPQATTGDSPAEGSSDAATAAAAPGGSNSRPTTAAVKDAVDRPTTSAPKSPGGAGRPTGTAAGGRKGKAAPVEEAPAAPLPRYTRSQLIWLSEIELLRSKVVAIDLDVARFASPSLQMQHSPLHANALGVEFDGLERSSKLRPATAGLHLPLSLRRQLGSSPSAGALLEGGTALKFPALSQAGAGGAPKSARSVLPSLTPRTSSPGRVAPRRAGAGGAAAAAAAAEEARQAALAAEAAAEAARRADPNLIEVERFRRLGRAAWLSARAGSWAQLQALVGHCLNALQAGRVKYTPAELAVRCFMLQPLLSKPGAVAAAAAAAPDTQVQLTNAPSSVPSEAGKASEHFSTPLGVVTTFARAVLAMLAALESGQSVYEGADTDRGSAAAPRAATALHMQLYRDVPAMGRFLAAHASTTGSDSAGDMWYLSKPGLSVLPLVRLLRYATAANFHAQHWAEVLHLGAEAHRALRGGFSHEWLKYAVYAGEETRHRAKSLAETAQQDLLSLRDTMERDARLIDERRQARRSQRGKREEEERMQLLLSLYHQRRAPLEAHFQQLDEAFRVQDALLAQMRAAAAAAAALAEPACARALLHARCKMVAYYNDAARSLASASGSRPGAGGGMFDEQLDAVAESREASRPVSRGGSVRDSEAGGRGEGTATADEDDDDDARSIVSLSSLGSAAMGGIAGGSALHTRKARLARDRSISAVVRSYQKAIALLRAESSPEAGVVLSRACHELGDFAWEQYGLNGQHAKREEGGARAWHDALDQTFGALNAAQQRHALVTPYETPSGSAPLAASSSGGGAAPTEENTLLARHGFWPCMSGLLAAGKLARLTCPSDGNMRLELVRIGAALARTLFHCSLAHPATDAAFASYQCEELWGGLGSGSGSAAGGGASDLFAGDMLRARAGQLLEALDYISTELLSARQAVRALPVATLHEHVARVSCRSVFHTVRARCNKLRALLDSGMLSEASLLYLRLLEPGSGDLPMAPATGLPVGVHASAVAARTAAATAAAAVGQMDSSRGGGGGGAGTAASSSKKKRSGEESGAVGSAVEAEPTEAERAAGTAVPVPPYHSHYPPLHSSNRGFLAYLMCETARARWAHSNLSSAAALYGGFVWGELRAIRAAFLFAIAGSAPARDQLSPLCDAALVADDAASAGESGAKGGAATGAKQDRRAKKATATGQPDSAEGGSGTRPRSANAGAGGADDSPPGSGPPSLAEKLAARSAWLRAAERVHVETIALFLPRDPAAPGREGALLSGQAAALPTPTGLRKNRKDRVGASAGEEETAAAAAQQAARRRTTQNFADLAAASTAAAAAAATAGATINGMPPGLSEQTAQMPPASADLLAALSRDCTLLPSALVSRAYSELARIRQSQGMLSDAVYFAKRSLRVMQEHAGSEVQIAAAQANAVPAAASAAGAATPAASMSRPRSPRSPRTPSTMTPRRAAAAALAGAGGGLGSAERDGSPAKEGSLQSLVRERTDKFVRELTVGGGNAGASANVGANGLLSVAPVAGAAPLSWRQVPDARTWLRTRLLLATLLIAQGRHAPAGEQLAALEEEVTRANDPLLAHETAALAARMLAAEGKFLAAFTRLKSAIWVEPTDADRAARAALVAKLPGGEAAMPPQVPRADTYAYDHGAALLQLLQLLRRLPAQDHLDARASRGAIHTAAILTRLESLALDALESHGVRPSDLELAGQVLPGSSLRAQSLAAAATPHHGRAGQSVAEQRRPGVVSLYHGWAAQLLEFNVLAARFCAEQAATRPDGFGGAAGGGLSAALKHALLAERLLPLWGGAPPPVHGEVAALVAKIAWRRVRESWASGASAPSLDVGMSPAQIAAEENVAARAAGATGASPPVSSGRAGHKSGSSRSPSPSLNKSSSAAGTAAAAGSAEQPRARSPGDGKKRLSSRDRDAAAAAALAAQAVAEADSTSAHAALAALTSNPLSSALWEESMGALPLPLRSAEPRSLRAILRRLHGAVLAGLAHGAQHTRVKRLCALLVEIHTELRAVAEAQQQRQTGHIAAAVRPFHQPLFHATMAALWVEVGARTGEAWRFLQRHAVNELAAHALPSLTSPEAAGPHPLQQQPLGGAAPLPASPAIAAAAQPFPLPAHVQAELTEAHRLRLERRRQEVAFLLAGQTDPAAAAALGNMVESKDGGAFGAAGGGGREARKDRERTRGGSGTHALPSSLASSSDEALSARTLLLYLLSLRAHVSARSFESEVAGAASVEESLALDVAEFLARGFAPYAERCALPAGMHAMLAACFGASVDSAHSAAEEDAATLATVRAALDEVGSAGPGAISGLWASRAQWALEAPRTDAAATKEGRLCLTMVLSTDVQRGVMGGAAVPAAAAAKGKKGGRASATTTAAPAPAAGSASSSSSGAAGSRKKKGAGANASPDDSERTPAQLLFGSAAPRFQLVRVEASKAEVAALAASASALRYAIEARLASAASAAAAASASAPATQAAAVSAPIGADLTPAEQLSFFELLLAVEKAFGSLRPAAALLAGTDSASDPAPPLAASTLAAYSGAFARECGLVASLAELRALESLLDCGEGSGASGGGAFHANSNGLALWLHHFSERGVSAMRAQAKAAAEAAEAAKIAAAAAPVAVPAKGSKAEREAAKAAAAAAAKSDDSARHSSNSASSSARSSSPHAQ